MRIEKSIIIQQSPETVFAFVTDMNNVTRWTPACSIQRVTEGPMQVGARFVQVAEMLGQQLEIMTEITAYKPCTLFAFKAISGPLPFENTFSFVLVDEGTRVDAVGEGEPGNFLKLARPLITSIVKKQVDEQLNILKRILEKPL